MKKTGVLLAAIVAVVCVFSLLRADSVVAEEISHIGNDQDVLVICVKYDDLPTRLGDCDDWVNLLQTEVNTYFDQATYGQTDFAFSTPVGGPADGWFPLGCNSTDDDCPGPKRSQDVIDLVDGHVDFARYHRIVVIYNNPDFHGQTKGQREWRTDEGGEVEHVEDGTSVWKRYMTLSTQYEWVDSASTPFDDAASVIAHELGHHLDLKTHYKAINWFPIGTRRVITPWDLMGLSPGLNHFLGWAKLERNWIPRGVAHVTKVGPPVGADREATVTLAPLETVGGTRLIEIPIVEEPSFFGYYVENRRRINGDENLPSSGVLITLVDDSPNTLVKAIVLFDPDSIGDRDQAALEVGDTYRDPAHNITITYVRNDGDDAIVRVNYDLPPDEKPNPSITPWGNPPWHTPDIWIDSESNGWGIYRYMNGLGEPEGNGDDAWVNHRNRVYVRVTNTGPGVATNVRVQVYRNSPPGMGDSGADWKYVGTIVFPTIPAHGAVEDFVLWTPTLGEHTCLKAVITDTPGELRRVDNVAQENVTKFETSSGSPYAPVGLNIRVNNPFENEKTPVAFHVRDIPDGWAVRVDPTDMTLDEGGFDFVTFEVFPSGFSKEAQERAEASGRYQPGYVGKPKIEALVPFADTFIPIGGVELWTHLVIPTQLTCDVPAGQRVDSTALRSNVRLSDDGSIENYRAFFEANVLARPESANLSVQGGKPITVKGRLVPAVQDARIAVEFVQADERIIRFARTDGEGAYTVTLEELWTGTWQVQAFFAGNTTFGKSESAVCIVDVKKG